MWYYIDLRLPQNIHPGKISRSQTVAPLTSRGLSQSDPPSVCLGLFPLQMFDWIMHNKGLFLTGYTEIGANNQHAMELQTQHNHFAMNCMVSDRYADFIWCTD